MRTFVFAILLACGMLSGCSRPTAPSDTDQQQGNPKAQPERSATSNDNKQPSDDQAGKDAHTGSRPDKKQ